ncbi:26586_t:CDS:2 [Dentiscutata erythropus]|uniref:26586_t:CDS:1 n=1 Tax=Dentiscutata erythropus TaxID=1348616 RepID=A0A9N9I162_9GLOM|nr:26586_t:CDS:2 [Dentiscutata erythropus]
MASRENNSLQAMEEFCKHMDKWIEGEGDRRRHAFNLGQLLLKANPSSRSRDGSTRGIFIIGDQSSAKSTTVNSIIKQVTLQMGSNTVTKVRTWIEHRYDPNLEHAEYDFNNMDDTMEARIIIRSDIPSFAIDCCDNPGLTPVNERTQRITDNITRRTLERVLERQNSRNDSIVVLCISALFFENASWPRHMDLIEQINGDNLIVLVTRMDQLNIRSIAQEIKDDEDESNSDDGNSELLRCSSWDILKCIRTKIERQTGSHSFPNGVQFHYAASSSVRWDVLTGQNGWNAFVNSEAENDRKMREVLGICDDEARLLHNEQEWRGQGIELIPMDPRQQSEFDRSVGMSKLQERLLQRLHVHIIKAAEELLDYTSNWRKAAKMELDHVSKRMKLPDDRAELITRFCTQFILVYQTLFSSPLYSPKINADPWFKEFGEGVKRGQESCGEYGWTSQDMWEIFKNLEDNDGYAEFPPQEFCDPNFDSYLEDIEKYVKTAKEPLYTAQMLIQRLTQEYTMRSTLIYLRDLDVKSFVARQVQLRTSTALSFGQAVDQKISEDYSQIFHKHEKRNSGGHHSHEIHGGNQWVSILGALCLLLHAEYTIRIMRDTIFSSLLQAQSDDPMHGILVSRFEQYWKMRKEKSIDQNHYQAHSTENQIAEIMKNSRRKPGSSKFLLSKNKVAPIEDLSWAIYAMFFESPYNHFKKTLDERTDLLMMTHATSLVHFYQLSGICVHQDEEYLIQWAADNPSSAYARAFLIREPDVKDPIKALTDTVNKIKSQGSDLDREMLERVLNKELNIEDLVTRDKEAKFISHLLENLKKFQRGRMPNDNNNESSEFDSTIFSDLSEIITERVRAIVMGKPPSSEDKVKLFVNIADMGMNPDSFPETESKTKITSKETSTVNYVYRRRLTMGITSSVIDTTQQLAKSQYEYSHQQTAPTLQRELLGRVASLILGYGYPYHPDERPSSKWYLSPKVIVQFLLANEDNFVNEENKPNNLEEWNWNSLLDPRMLESPLVKRILFLCNPTENDDYDPKTVSHYIKQLEKCKYNDMDEYIIEILSDDRFNWKPDQENLYGKVDSLKNEIIKYSKWHVYIEAYKKVAEPVLLRNEDLEPEINFEQGEIITELDELYEGNETN